MEEITFPIFLYLCKTREGKDYISLSGHDTQCFFGCGEARVTYSHWLDESLGEPVIVIDSFDNEYGFTFHDKVLAPGVAATFKMAKDLLERDGTFFSVAFSKVADEYAFTGSHHNDPEGRWRRTS